MHETHGACARPTKEATMTMKNWTLERHLERLNWTGDNIAAFYLAERQARRVGARIMAGAWTIILVCAGAVGWAVWG